MAINLCSDGIGLFVMDKFIFNPVNTSILVKAITSPKSTDRGHYRSRIEQRMMYYLVDMYRIFGNGVICVLLWDPILHEFMSQFSEAGFESDIETWSTSIELGTGVKYQNAGSSETEATEAKLAWRRHKCCRLSTVSPMIIEIQTIAIVGAACIIWESGVVVEPKILIPSVTNTIDIFPVLSKVRSVAEIILSTATFRIEYKIGCIVSATAFLRMGENLSPRTNYFSILNRIDLRNNG